MNTNGSLPIPPVRNSLESDPAYDYAEDAPVIDDETEEEELFDEAEDTVELAGHPFGFLLADGDAGKARDTLHGG